MPTPPSDLSSSGAVTQHRDAAERAVAPAVRRAFGAFLAVVRTTALRDPLVYSAAEARGSDPQPFTPAAVTAAWAGFVDAAAAALATVGPDTPEWRAALRDRLTADPTPTDVYTVASEALATGDPDVLRAALVLDTLTAAAPPPPNLAYTSTSAPYDWLSVAQRLTRSEVTAAVAAGVTTELGSQGYTRQRWVAHHDARTREAHAAADGQTVPVGSEFVVGGEVLQYPGDPHGTPENTFNCRCVVVGVRWRADRQ